MQGGYCFQYGQSDTDFDLPVGEFAREFASEAFSLDSRLLLTLRPLFFKPGAVPRAYVAGHRARFVPPIRLYIFASFSMFLIIALGSGVRVELDLGTGATATASESPAGAESVGPIVGSFGERIEDRFEVGAQRIAEDPKSFSRLFMTRRRCSSCFLPLPCC